MTVYKSFNIKLSYAIYKPIRFAMGRSEGSQLDHCKASSREKSPRSLEWT